MSGEPLPVLQHEVCADSDPAPSNSAANRLSKRKGLARFDSTIARRLKGLSTEESADDSPAEVGLARKQHWSNARRVKANVISVTPRSKTAKGGGPHQNNVQPNNQPPKRPDGRPGGSGPPNPQNSELPAASSLRRKEITSIRPVIPGIVLGRREGQRFPRPVKPQANSVPSTRQPAQCPVGPRATRVPRVFQAPETPASLAMQKRGTQGAGIPVQHRELKWREQANRW